MSGQTSSTDFPGAPAIKPNPTAGFYSKFTPQLNALDYTTLLGASIAGIAIFHPVSTFNISPAIFAAGYRFTGGTGSQNSDAFVVQLSESAVLTFQ